MSRLIEKIRPDEVYNLASQSHVGISFDMPEYSTDVNALGTLRLLEAIHDYAPDARCYQASTSEMFGKVQEVPQKETTPFYPRSPYAAAKVYAYWIMVNYREAYGIHASNGILFNHESPVRGETFVTRKITRALARIKEGLQDKLFIGNLESRRDWGHAKDFVEAMWLMLQQDSPDDYVIATGKQYSVRQFIEAAANEMGMDIEWAGDGVEETGTDQNTGKQIIGVDPRYFRPTEVETLLGDPSKAKKVLGWEAKIPFEQLVSEMVRADHEAAQRDALIREAGYRTHDYHE